MISSIEQPSPSKETYFSDVGDSTDYNEEFYLVDLEPQNSTNHEENPKIAGFSQQELLEIINLVKMTYYVSDLNGNNPKFLN